MHVDLRTSFMSCLQLKPVTCPPPQDGTILEGVKQPWVLRPPMYFWSSSPSALSIHLLGGPGSKRGQWGMLPDTQLASSAQQLSGKSLRSSVDPLACLTTSSIHRTQETQKEHPHPRHSFQCKNLTLPPSWSPLSRSSRTPESRFGR